jgi:hypothetical protein
MASKRTPGGQRGKLRIGDDWNAIRIIALSQSNPLKAIAEFVENSIDAHANTVTITRGREHGEHYLSIRDDGAGIRAMPTDSPTSNTSPRTSAIRSRGGSRPTAGAPASRANSALAS